MKKKFLVMNRRRGARMEELGNASQNIIENDLQKMKQDSKIEDYIKTEKWSLADRRGADFIITTLDKKSIPLQVKSSTRGTKTHRKKYPNIPSIAEPKHIENRLEKIMRVIEAFTNGKVLHLNPFNAENYANK